MKAKTKKSVAKRLMVTKTGKIMKRYGGQDHFNARDTGKQGRKKRRDDQMSESYRRNLKALLPNHNV
jgi:ribosomal protein L35